MSDRNSTPEPTWRQIGRIRLLESLTGTIASRPRTTQAASQVIRQLEKKANAVGVPEYRYRPAPVKRYVDRSIVRDS